MAALMMWTYSSHRDIFFTVCGRGFRRNKADTFALECVCVCVCVEQLLNCCEPFFASYHSNSWFYWHSVHTSWDLVLLYCTCKWFTHHCSIHFNGIILSITFTTGCPMMHSRCLNDFSTAKEAVWQIVKKKVWLHLHSCKTRSALPLLAVLVPVVPLVSDLEKV